MKSYIFEIGDKKIEKELKQAADIAIDTARKMAKKGQDVKYYPKFNPEGFAIMHAKQKKK